MSANGDNEFFCDGITEEIINALANIEQLKVTSRTSSFYFKGKHIPVKEIGQQLEVSTILEGSARIGGDMLRITAQLINVENDSHFWSETWDRKLENIFEIQDEISLQIAEKLREHFGHLDISDHLVQNPTHNLGAHEHYLRGRSLFNKWNPKETNEAIGHFEQAVKLDPNLIDAHTGLADGYSFLAVTGFAPREESWNKAIQSLDRARAIDPDNAPLNYLLANQAFFTEADFSQAMHFTVKSIESKPTYSEAQQFMSFLYMLRDDLEQAEKHLLYAYSIDPLNQETQFYQAYFHYRKHEFEESERLLRGLLEENSYNLPALITLLYVLIKLSRLEEARSLLRGTPKGLIMPDEILGLECLIAISEKNPQDHAQDLIGELEAKAMSDSSFQAHTYWFLANAVLGRPDGAFEVLEKAFQNKSSILQLAFGDPLAESLRSDGRYSKFYDRLYPIRDHISKPKKSNSSSLDEKAAKDYVVRLNEFIELESPFLNPSLTLRSLAEQIEIHPNQLSWLLNERLSKNFNEFINELRVEHFKKLVVDPSNNHISLIGLAFESGFNSKTVFNTVFKKITGMTPRAFQKSQG